MKIVGYKQPQTVAAQKADDKPKEEKKGGSKPNGADKDAKQDGGSKPADDKPKDENKSDGNK